MPGIRFEWDAAKAKRNLKKHRVSFTEASETFSNPDGFVLEDEEHSALEQRFYWIGKSANGRILTTRFTRRRGKIRIIGAGEWREFRRIYHEKAGYNKA